MTTNIVTFGGARVTLSNKKSEGSTIQVFDASWSEYEFGGDGYIRVTGCGDTNIANLGDMITCDWGNPMMVRTVKNEYDSVAGMETVYLGLVSKLKLFEQETLQFSVGYPPDPHSKVYGTGGTEYPGADENWVINSGEVIDTTDETNGLISAAYLQDIDNRYVDRQKAWDWVVGAGGTSPAGMRLWEPMTSHASVGGSLSAKAFSFPRGTSRMHILKKLASTLPATTIVSEAFNDVSTATLGNRGDLEFYSTGPNIKILSCSVGEEFAYPNNGIAYWRKRPVSQEDIDAGVVQFKKSTASSPHAGSYKISAAYYSGAEGVLGDDSNPSGEGAEAIRGIINRPYSLRESGWVKLRGFERVMIGQLVDVHTGGSKFRGYCTKVVHHVDTHEHYTLVHLGQADPRVSIWGAGTALASIWDSTASNRTTARPQGEMLEAIAYGLGENRVDINQGIDDGIVDDFYEDPNSGGGNTVGVKGWVTGPPLDLASAVMFSEYSGRSHPIWQKMNGTELDIDGSYPWYRTTGIVDPFINTKIWITPGAIICTNQTPGFRHLRSGSRITSWDGSLKEVDSSTYQGVGFVTSSGDVVVYQSGGGSAG